MARLTLTELDDWVRGFQECEDLRAIEAPRTIDASWDPALVDTALVVVRLSVSGTEAYLSRQLDGSPEWTVTFERREHDASVSAEQVVALAAEVATVGRLCAHLTRMTAEHHDAAHAPTAGEVTDRPVRSISAVPSDGVAV